MVLDAVHDRLGLDLAVRGFVTGILLDQTAHDEAVTLSFIHQILRRGYPCLQADHKWCPGGAAPSVRERKERMRPVRSHDGPAPRSLRIDPGHTSQRVR